MPKAGAADCFYCGCELHGLGRQRSTTDHVFPKSDLRSHRPRPSAAWLALNTVPCCASCNSRKGATDPMEWLLQLGPRGADRLAHLLRRLGMPGDKVDAAMGRRG